MKGKGPVDLPSLLVCVLSVTYMYLSHLGASAMMMATSLVLHAGILVFVVIE